MVNRLGPKEVKMDGIQKKEGGLGLNTGAHYPSTKTKKKGQRWMEMQINLSSRL